MNRLPSFALTRLVTLLLGSALGLSAQAAPTVSRLTPPANPLLPTATALSRFLPGQKFDLQATLQPDAGSRITTVTIAVDDQPVASLRHDGNEADQFDGATSLVKSGLVKGLKAGSVVASVRGYAQTKPGIHRLTVKAEDNNGG